MICIEQLYIYGYKNDVVWIYVATNNENYIMSNWIYQLQWINSKLKDKEKIIKVGELVKNNYYVKYNDQYNDYSESNLFKDDIFLYQENFNLFNKSLGTYQEIKNLFNEDDWLRFIETCEDNEEQINNIYDKFGDIGISRNIDFEKYLSEFQTYILLVKNIMLYALDNSWEIKNKRYLIKKDISKLEEVIFKIEEESKYWIDRFT